MNSALDKILNVEVSYLSKLPQVDQVACLKIMSEYNDSFNQLSYYYKEFSDRLEKGETKGVSESSYQYFSFKGSLEIIKRNLKHVKDIHFRSITRHFIEVYNFDKNFFKSLEVSFEKEDCFVPLDLEKILRFIFSQTSGLVSAGFENVKNYLKNRIWKADRVSVKNSKLSIADFVWFDSYSWNGPRLETDREGKYVYNIILAFSYFDYGNFENTNKFLEVLPHEVYSRSTISFEQTYQVPSDNIVSMKFFKNRRLDITFKSAELCKKFVNMFELNQIQER